MRAHHSFESSEQEILEITASLLQQSGYRISHIQKQGTTLSFTATCAAVASEQEERARIETLVEHFAIECWSVRFV
ncbi:hypothetical protein [Exiguobacterium aurantiacum]|uniref:Uncharacterized protein n=1 Tax=Exiguobacterium aurantiacum TaxID=33987 RepID=A0A377FTE5_9BACL|nr:hypothetical protein [Exiguobacterium aurantiacum]STO08101.1 Uncharacterised protein [Exiguobacterium aurantiacum]